MPTNQQKIRSWQEIKREELFLMYGRGLERVHFKMPGGETTDFYIQKEKSTACVFALTEKKEVILIEQYRPGPKKILRELPGGYIDSNEKPIQAAHREFSEEAGFSGNLKAIGHSFHSAHSTRTKYYFIATSCTRKPSPQQLDSEKYSRVVLSSIADFLKDLHSGNLTDADCAYAALHYLSNKES